MTTSHYALIIFALAVVLMTVLSIGYSIYEYLTTTTEESAETIVHLTQCVGCGCSIIAPAACCETCANTQHLWTTEECHHCGTVAAGHQCHLDGEGEY